MFDHAPVPIALDATTRRLLGAASVELWITRDGAHTTSACPAGPGGAWADVRAEHALAQLCGVCAELLPFASLAGYGPVARAGQMALHLRAAERLSLRTDGCALAQSGIHAASARAVRAAMSRDNLGAAMTTALDAASVRLDCVLSLLALHRAADPQGVSLELYRRHLVDGDGRSDVPTPPSAGWAKPAWRAVRWAVRSGVDPSAAAAAVTPDHRREITAGYVAAWLDAIDETAARDCHGPRHLIAAVARAPVESSRTRSLAALGVLVPDEPTPKAACVPAPLVPTLASPGVSVIDAGPVCVSLAEEPAVCRAYLGLWDPSGTGPLSDPSEALSAARVLLGAAD